MFYCVEGVRLGTRINTPTGWALNGAITYDDSEAIRYLRKSGYKVKRCAGIPEWRPTEEEIAEMIAADKLLGIHRGESGTTRIERGLKKGMRDLLDPLRRALRGHS